MENTIAQDLCMMKNKAQVLGSLITSLRGQVTEQGAQKHAESLCIVWSELESSISEIAEGFEYLAGLSKENNIPELLHALKSR